MKQEMKVTFSDGRHAKRKQPEVYRMEFEQLAGDEFELISEYTRSWVTKLLQQI